MCGVLNTPYTKPHSTEYCRYNDDPTNDEHELNPYEMIVCVMWLVNVCVRVCERAFNCGTVVIFACLLFHCCVQTQSVYLSKIFILAYICLFDDQSETRWLCKQTRWCAWVSECSLSPRRELCVCHTRWYIVFCRCVYTQLKW